MYDNSFEFKQNSVDDGRVLEQKQRKKQPLNQDQEIKIPWDRSIIISSNQSFGINVQKHSENLQKFFQEKIIRESLTKAVVGTFERKNLIREGQFQIQKAYQDTTYQTKNCADKVQTWVSDSVANTPALLEFERYKKKKSQQRSAKVASIINLIQKIAQKVQDKKLDYIKKQFEQSLEQKVINLPENYDYNRAKYKLKFLNQRVAANKKKLQQYTIENSPL